MMRAPAALALGLRQMRMAGRIRSWGIRGLRAACLADGECGCLGAAGEAEFGQDVRDMVFGGASADVQPGGDVGVGQAYLG